MRRGAWLIGMVFLLGQTGCQRLKFETTVTRLTPLMVHELIFDPPAYSQNVKVTISPTVTGVSAYLVKEEDKAVVVKALDTDKEPAASLLLASRVSKGSAETYSFEATIPPKTAYVLLLKGSGKTTDVKVNVMGR